jgi:cation:H+ antiporter
LTVSVLFVLAGLALLVVGAEVLVNSASHLAMRARMAPAVIGVTVVAWGTSMPELVVSVDASLGGTPDIAVGNVVGSNLYNILLILGLAAVITPMAVARQTLRLDAPVMLGAAIALAAAGWDGRIGRIEGGLLVAGMLAYTAALYRGGGGEEGDVSAPGGSMLRDLVGTVAAVALLGGGAHLLIEGAVHLAEGLGVSQRVIALTLVALGTSLPELFTSVVAAIRGKDDIAVSNVVGSNVFNVLGIVGVSAAIHPLDVNPEMRTWDIPCMVGVTIVLLLLMRPGRRVGRWRGVALLLGAAAYTWSLTAP